MKFIYQLKDPNSRQRFTRGYTDFYIDNKIIKLFKAVCLIKSNELEEARSLINQWNLLYTVTMIGRRDLIDLCELIAVLWAQEEETSTLYSCEQAELLRTVLEQIGGYELFWKQNENFSLPTDLKIRPSYNYSRSYPSIKVVLFTRARWGGSLSRLHPLNAVLGSLLASAGLNYKLLDSSTAEGAQQLLSLRNCLIIFDVQDVGLIKTLELVNETKRAGNKTVGLFTDFHLLEFLPGEYENLKNFDIIWSSSHTVEQFNNLIKLDNFSDFPANGDFNFEDSLKAPTTKNLFGFIGSIERNNLPRIFFYVESVKSEKFKFELTSHYDDKLGLEESYLEYLGRLRSFECILNFSLRYSGERIITGRILEAIAAGRCLIQEYTPLLQRWFTPGEHYIDFRTAEDLYDIIERAQCKQLQIDTIARAANSYNKTNYSPTHLLRHFFSII